jgi:hypothetical protein
MSHRKKLIGALLAGLAAAVAYLLNEQTAAPPAPAVGSVVAEPVKECGWVRDPAAVAAAADGPGFAATEAFRAAYDGPDDVFLWDACRAVTGDLLPPRDQGGVGSCVGFGVAAAVEHLMCVQIAAGSRERFRDLAPEVIYAGSRVEVGGGRIGGDGSVGAWAARFVRDWGVVPRGVHGPHDLSRYSESACRRLGAAGLPSELETLAREHPVKAVSRVGGWAEGRAAVRNGYPVAVCSSRGFTMSRDADGFARPSGVWMHCMALVGVRGGSRPGGFLLNSWGPHAHTGPRGAGHPSPAGFWADAGVLDRMLAEGDSWAFSGVTGFPARTLDWYALKRQRVELALRAVPAGRPAANAP